MSTVVHAHSHLFAELARLDLLLRRQIVRLRAADPGALDDPYRGLYVPDAQVDSLLRTGASASTAGASASSATGPRQAEPAEAQALSAEIARRRAENWRHAALRQAQRPAAEPAEALAAEPVEAPPEPVEALAQACGLSEFEVDVLLLAIAPELDARYETLYAYVQNDATRRRPTVGLALAMLADSAEERLARRACFDPDAPLFANRLLQLGDDPQDRSPALPARFFKTDARVVDHVLGIDRLDVRLRPFVARARPAGDPSTLPAALRAGLAAAAEDAAVTETVFFFHGPAGSGRCGAALSLCAHLGRGLLVVDVGRAAAAMPLREVLALLGRETMLSGAALYLDGCEALFGEDAASARTALTDYAAAPDAGDDVARRVTGPLFLASEVAWGPTGAWGETRFMSFTFPLPAAEQRVQLWQQALAQRAADVDAAVDLPALADRFVLGGGQIVDAVRAAARQAALRSPEARQLTTADLYTAARRESSGDLERLAHKIEPAYTWPDIILPRRQMQALREICDALRFRHVVNSTWGFAHKLALGKGLTVLFSGPSGTGKTMAAQVMAHELGLDLYRIDLASVVSKYIGETEKNLSQIFRTAEASNAILFFDEADALFGKRSEVKDAHDRYANIEVAYLLQKMEDYSGMAILATNLSRNIDDAFARRMSHTVEFPFPDAPHRQRIWRHVFPPAAPIGTDVDLPFLAGQFQLTGGNIRNIALTAAYMAAADGGIIGMRQLIMATAREIQKMGKVPSHADFRDYYDWLRDGG